MNSNFGILATTPTVIAAGYYEYSTFSGSVIHKFQQQAHILTAYVTARNSNALVTNYYPIPSGNVIFKLALYIGGSQIFYPNGNNQYLYLINGNQIIFPGSILIDEIRYLSVMAYIPNAASLPSIDNLFGDFIWGYE